MATWTPMPKHEILPLKTKVMLSLAGQFYFRPALKSDKTAVLAIAPDIYNGFDYMEWQYDMLVDLPDYYPWVCEPRVARGKIVGFAFGFLSDFSSCGNMFCIGGGRTSLDYRKYSLIKMLSLHIVKQATGGCVPETTLILGAYNQPHYLTDTIAKACGFGSVVLLHSCLAFELSPSLRCQLTADLAVAPAEEVSSTSSACDVFAEVASPEAFLAAETADSATGVGLGPGDYMVLLREAFLAGPQTLARMHHWTAGMLASRRGTGAGIPLSGVSFANRFTCPAGVNLVLNIYACDEAAASSHIVEQLRRYLLQQSSRDVLDRTVFLTAYFASGLILNEVLSRLHLTRWLGGGRLPLCNLPQAMCDLRVTRTELRQFGAKYVNPVTDLNALSAKL